MRRRTWIVIAVSIVALAAAAVVLWPHRQRASADTRNLRIGRAARLDPVEVAKLDPIGAIREWQDGMEIPVASAAQTVQN